MSRSKDGCYTCRIRKKKCDEGRPVCQNCSSREIECLGFGSKPRWIVGVSRDADVFKGLKKAASVVYKKRRNPWSRYDDHVKRERGMAKEMGVEESPGGVICAKHGTSEMKPSWRYESLFVTPSMDSIWWHSGLITSTYNNIRNKTELNLVHHYLKFVFPRIHEFHPTACSTVVAPNEGQGWVLNLLLRSKPMYLSILSLSSCHRILITTGKSQHGSREEQSLAHLNSATLRTLQGKLATVPSLHGTELLATGFELLGCMIEVTALEVFRDIEGLYNSAWETHMRGIRSLLAAIAPDPVLKGFLHNPAASEQLDTVEALLTYSHSQLLSKDDSAAFKYLITNFVWADILSQSLGICPPDETQTMFRYAPLLEYNILDLSRVMGAQNWAMVSIYYINMLRFLREANKPAELLAHASLIAARLERELVLLLAARPSLTSLQLDGSLVTECFALASLVYLRVEVVGSHPDEQSIEAAVKRSLVALEALPTRLLVRVAWPFAVTGCMAQEVEQGLFRGMVYAAVKAGEPCGTAVKALKLMRTCWEARREDEGADTGFGWQEAMKRLGVRVLIV